VQKYCGRAARSLKKAVSNYTTGTNVTYLINPGYAYYLATEVTTATTTQSGAQIHYVMKWPVNSA